MSYHIHPADASNAFNRRTMVSLQLLYAIEAAREEHGDKWVDHLGHFMEAEPVDLLIQLARDLYDAGRNVTSSVTEWGEKTLKERFVWKESE